MKKSQLKKKLLKSYPHLTQDQIEAILKSDQKGKGLLSALKSTINKVKGCTPEKRFLYTANPGEHHQVVYKDGCAYTDAFSGPGTKVGKHIEELAQRHGPNVALMLQNANFPEPQITKTAMKHDIEYLMAKTKDDIRKADLKMIETLQKNKGKIAEINRQPALKGIQIKVKAEDLGAPVFGLTKNETISEPTMKLIEDVKENLEMQGYGTRPVRPIGCPYCGSTAKNLKTHQKSKKCQLAQAQAQQ